MTDYTDYVRLVLNCESVRVRHMMDTVDAMRVALGQATIPEAWYDLLSTTGAEKAVWKANELRREL